MSEKTRIIWRRWMALKVILVMVVPVLMHFRGRLAGIAGSSRLRSVTACHTRGRNRSP